MVLIGGAVLRNPNTPHLAAVTEPVRRTTEVNLTLRQALRTRQWWLLTATLAANVAVSLGFIGSASGAGATIAHLNPGECAVLVSLISLANGAGRVVWALVADRIGHLLAFVVILMIQCHCLILMPFAHDQAAIYLLGATIGLCCGGGFGVMPAAAGRAVGLAHGGGI